MTVGKKYGVNFADIFAQSLAAEIRTYINKYVFIISCLNIYGAAGSFIAGIF